MVGSGQAIPLSKPHHNIFIHEEDEGQVPLSFLKEVIDLFSSAGDWVLAGPIKIGMKIFIGVIVIYACTHVCTFVHVCMHVCDGSVHAAYECVWVRCFMLYIAVMSQKRPEQTVPMTAHLHMVIRLHELAWFYYDWKVHRETCAMAPAE